MKFSRAKTKFIFFVLVASLTLVFAYKSIYRNLTGGDMNAMNCEKLATSEFQKELLEFSSQSPYKPPLGQKLFRAKFQFNLNETNMQETTLIIQSSKAQKAIYIGPFKQRVEFEVSENLLSEKGYDNFKILLFKKETQGGNACVDEHQALYWQAGKTVFIDFLNEREINPRTGEPASIKVWSE